jgi:hypothetical protein
MNTTLLIIAGGLVLMIVITFFFLRSKVKEVDDKTNILNAKIGQFLGGGLISSPPDSSGGQNPIYVTGRRPPSSMGGSGLEEGPWQHLSERQSFQRSSQSKLSQEEIEGSGAAAAHQIPSRMERGLGIMGGLMGQIPTFMASIPTEEDILEVSDADEEEEIVEKKSKKKASH